MNDIKITCIDASWGGNTIIEVVGKGEVGSLSRVLVEYPNWFERLVGITLKRKVEDAKVLVRIKVEEQLARFIEVQDVIR